MLFNIDESINSPVYGVQQSDTSMPAWKKETEISGTRYRRLSNYNSSERENSYAVHSSCKLVSNLQTSTAHLYPSVLSTSVR